MKTEEETFRLDEDCIGVTWREDEGWYGCLRWSSGLRDTDHVGPFLGVVATRIALRYSFVLWMNALGEAAL